MVDEWRPVAGYEGIYEVSATGEVRSLPRTVRHWRGGPPKRTGRVLRAAPNGRGYLNVVLCVSGAMKTTAVARIVASAFIPNPSSLPQVNHKNGIKTDNSASNLEWTDSACNQLHAWATGLQPARQREMCPRGHSMADAYVRPDGSGRMCRTCARIREAARERF